MQRSYCLHVEHLKLHVLSIGTLCAAAMPPADKTARNREAACATQMICLGTEMEPGIAAAIAPSVKQANAACLEKRKAGRVTGSMNRKDFPKVFPKLKRLRVQFGPTVNWALTAASRDRLRLQFGRAPNDEGECASIAVPAPC